LELDPPLGGFAATIRAPSSRRSEDARSAASELADQMARASWTLTSHGFRRPGLASRHLSLLWSTETTCPLEFTSLPAPSRPPVSQDIAGPSPRA